VLSNTSPTQTETPIQRCATQGKDAPLSEDSKPELSYSEFNNRRSELLGKIRTAQRVYDRATDTRYTPLNDEYHIVIARYMRQLDEQLNVLVNQYEEQKKRKEVNK
jgi:hypothetical protein